MKHLALNVHDAVLFYKVDFKCPIDRIWYAQIANCIAVLSGDIPISYKKDINLFKKEMKKYINIANNSRIEMTSIPEYEGIRTKQIKTVAARFPTMVEGNFNGRNIKVLTCNYAPFDELRYAIGYNEWYMLDKLAINLYGTNWRLKGFTIFTLMEELANEYGKGNKYVIEYVNKEHNNKVRKSIIGPIIGDFATFDGNPNKLKGDKKGLHSSSTFRYIGSENNWNEDIIHLLTKTHIYNSVENIVNYNFTIHLKLTDEEYNSILNGPNVATIYDGGLVTFDFPNEDSTDSEWVDEYYNNFDEPFKEDI